MKNAQQLNILFQNSRTMNTKKKITLIAFIIATASTVLLSPSAFMSPALGKVNPNGGNDDFIHKYNSFSNCRSGADGITTCFADRGYTNGESRGGSTDFSDDETENVVVSVINYNSIDQSSDGQSIDDPYEEGWD